MRHILSRVAFALGTLLFVITFNFFLFRAAGDPERDLLRGGKLTPAAIDKIIEERGLHDSLPTQYWLYLKSVASGDLERSFDSGKPVTDELLNALPNTLILVGSAVLIAMFVGTWLGIAAGSRRGSKLDTALTQGSLTFYSMPEFWLGMILIWIFAVQVTLFPTGLKSEPGATYGTGGYTFDVVQHAILPTMTLAIGIAGQYTVLMRSALTDTLAQDFVTTARAIGLPRRRVLRAHAVPNAILPVVTLAALNLGFVVGGAITVEALFSWPGIGQLTIQAINFKDYPMLQGIFLLSSFAVIVLNLITDILYTYLDPRVRID